MTADDAEGNPGTGNFSFQAASSGLPARCEVAGADDSDCDGIPDNYEDINNNGIVDTGETDPDLKTLFVRPNQWGDPTWIGFFRNVNYWPKFLEFFPNPTRPGFAEIPALTEAGIEVVVIGDPRHLNTGGYGPWGNFEYDPASDTTRPYCDIMEVLYLMIVLH